MVVGLDGSSLVLIETDWKNKSIMLKLWPRNILFPLRFEDDNNQFYMSFSIFFFRPQELFSTVCSHFHGHYQPTVGVSEAVRLISDKRSRQTYHECDDSHSHGVFYWSLGKISFLTLLKNQDCLLINCLIYQSVPSNSCESLRGIRDRKNPL